MSIAEIAPETSPIFSYLMPALATGESINTTPIPNYNGATSKIIGCVRVTVAGVAPGTGRVVAVQGAQVGTAVPAVPGYGTIRLVSEEGLGDDLSTYRVYWTNEVAQSQLITILSC